nr:reverse transcriptase domain-containing protein [Tanacetum cinerariifolium]GFA01573.1 reverse transcriptase domain-containing protein [Tanacetum cinerariifolium]
MRISEFLHGITNPELIKCLHDKILKTVDEMMRVTTSFPRGEVAALNHEQKKSFPPWKQQEGNQKQNFKKGGFQNQQRQDRKHDRFTLLTKTPKEIFAFDKGKFKSPPPLTTPVEKRNHTKFYEFHGEVGHNTDGQRITQSFSPNPKIIFPPLGEDEGTEGPMIIKAEIRGHCIHRMSPFSYNGIIGRPRVRKLQAVLSTAHKMLKFPVEGGVITLKSSRMIPLKCATVFRPERNLLVTKQTTKERIKKPVDMTGVPRNIVEHRLNVREGCSPARQKIRGQAADRNQTIQKEVRKLVEAGIMKEVHYHDWLSNPVMVKKHDDSWKMCVDFKDLNKACLKDGYPLLEIDWKVESLYGFPFKCFLDANKGYHQIQMAKEDEEKTAFITRQGIFCYTKMPFGLRNAKAT